MSWTVLCIGDDPSGILLYQSMLELDGHSVLVASSAIEALRASKARAVDCAVIDHERDGMSIARQIARAWPGLRILFVADRAELPFQIYAEAGMFITKDEAIEGISGCVQEMMQRNVNECSKGCSGNRTHGTDDGSRPVHRGIVRWILPW